MTTCPKCGAGGCGTVWRKVQTIETSDGYENAEGIFIEHRREWTVTQIVVEDESATCLRRQLAAMTARAEAAEAANMNLLDALRYYANPLVWKESYDGTYDCSWASIELDKGNIARAAIAVLPPPPKAERDGQS